MIDFELSPELDKNKVFLVMLGELEGRLDPHFYKPFFRGNEHRIKNVEHDKLSNLIEFSSESWNQKNIFSETFPYIEIGEIDLYTGEINQINNIDIREAPSRAKMIVRNGDILVSTTRPSRGAISHIEDDGLYIASTGFSIIRKLITTSISKRFLFYWLRQSPSLWQMEQRSSGGNYPAITQEELAKIKIPIPPKEIQAEIVAKMDTAYASKKQKEAEAQRLLGSIDAYLLGELGIELPEQQENTLQSRIFTRQLSEVSGGRFDPKWYDNKTVSLKASINSSSFPKTQLKHLVIGSVAGDWGNELNTGTDGFSKCLVIRATEFDNSFNLKLDNLRLKYRLINNKKLLKINVKDNDLLIEKSGGSSDQPVGRVAIITRDVLNHYDVIGYSNFVQKIRVNESYISPCYLFCFLKCIHNIGLTDAMQSQTNGIRNLIMANYFSQSIPLPPLEKQTEIANHISEIRKQAKQLQQQAKTELEHAKKEVEAMILGEDANKA